MTSTDVRHVLEVWADVRMAEVLRSLSAVTVRSAGSSTESTALHDTADLRLVRSGVQLLRSASTDGDLWDLTVEPSPFWHRDLGSTPVRWMAPADAGPPEAVHGLLRTAPLTEVLVERTTIRAWTVTRPRPEPEPDAQVAPDLDGQAPAGESTAEEPAAVIDAPDTPVEPPQPASVLVTLNDLAVLRRRRVATRRTQVVVDGDPDLARAVVALLEAQGAEPAESGIPAMDVLGARAQRPVVPTELEGDTSVRALVRVALGRSVERLLANDVAIRLDLGPEAVHQARVATRRLRSDLKTLRPVLDERWVNVIDRELKWLGGLLGDVRDVEVLQERLAARVAELPSADHAVGSALLATLDGDHDVAADALHRALVSHRYARLLDGLVDAADTPHVVADAPEARPVLVELVAVPWAQLRKKARRTAREGSEVEDLHDLRLRAKRVRYAFDMAALVIPAAARHNKRVAGLQDELGDLHDASVAEDWLRSRATRHGLEGAFVIGSLCAREQAEIARGRRRWMDVWERADERKVAGWLRDGD